MDKGNNWFIIFVHQLPEAEMDTCQTVGSFNGETFKVTAREEDKEGDKRAAI